MAADDPAECDRWITWITISQSGRDTSEDTSEGPVGRSTRPPARAAYGLAAQLAQQELDDSAFEEEATTANPVNPTTVSPPPPPLPPPPPPPQFDGLLAMLFSDPTDSADSTTIGPPAPAPANANACQAVPGVPPKSYSGEPDPAAASRPPPCSGAGTLNAAGESGASGPSFEPVLGESGEHLFELIEDEFGPAGKEAPSPAPVNTPPQAGPALEAVD